MSSFVSSHWLRGWRRQDRIAGDGARRALTAAILLIAAVSAGTASAQSVTGVAWARAGTLAGLVVDGTEAVVPGVKVVAVNVLTGTARETLTGGDGWFVMPLLPAGAYVMTVERDGSAPLEIKNSPLSRARWVCRRRAARPWRHLPADRSVRARCGR